MFVKTLPLLSGLVVDLSAKRFCGSTVLSAICCGNLKRLKPTPPPLLPNLLTLRNPATCT
ncbi:MAG: hypothetical protein LBK06_09380 [Planctomycetaceae bacterium]|nr:hypothetical protein [Planctomycetaceae bacterium]